MLQDCDDIPLAVQKSGFNNLQNLFHSSPANHPIQLALKEHHHSLKSETLV
jgi:hypothetical protein